MKRATCPRLFEVEAMRDGRLTGVERASFERHMESCTACSREEQALEALAREARASMRTPEEQDELHVRRERTRLLAAFDGTLVGTERPRHRWVWGIALVALVLGVVVAWRSSMPGPLEGQHAVGSSAGGPAATLGSSAATVGTPAALAAPPVPARSTVIQADANALYSKRAEGDRERIVLERGMLRIQVTHTHPPDEAALLVTLPDGELEDAGTTFTVTVADGRTTHVAVEEGSIVLRLRQRPPIVLRAGEAWSLDLRPPAGGASAAASGEGAAPPRPSAGGNPSGAMPPNVPDPSSDFREAMAALKASDHRRAAALFAAFLQAHPHDARTEDAAYLRVVALHRAGNEPERREAARAYLRDHPAGFRRAEVEKLAQ